MAKKVDGWENAARWFLAWLQVAAMILVVGILFFMDLDVNKSIPGKICVEQPPAPQLDLGAGAGG